MLCVLFYNIILICVSQNWNCSHYGHVAGLIAAAIVTIFIKMLKTNIIKFYIDCENYYKASDRGWCVLVWKIF